MKVVVAQKGAREHYAVARALYQQVKLAGLVTDWYAFGKQKAETLKAEKLTSEVANQRLHGPRKVKWGNQKLFQRLSISAFQHFGRRGQSALAARSDGIPDDLVQAMPLRSLWWKWRVRKAPQHGQHYDGYVETDAAFASAVARLKLPQHEVFFGYSYASLEMLTVEKKRGVLTVLDQIDPGLAEFRLVAEEMARFPELAGEPPEFPTAYYERNRREWELADVIVVNSEWTREAIIVEGANPAKIEILPLAYEVAQRATTSPQDNETSRPEVRGQRSEVSSPRKAAERQHGEQWSVVSSPPSTLRVLWLGQVNLRKGIYYLMEAARLLEHEKVHFDVVGAIGILPGAVASAPNNMTFHGPVSRDEATDWYQRADVFVLPTLSDGFAITQLEALAHGLPVIVTPNCGRVVENNKTGLIIPPHDAKAFAEAILRFLHNPGLTIEMGSYCREAAKAYSVETYGTKLVGIIEKHMSHPKL